MAYDIYMGENVITYEYAFFEIGNYLAYKTITRAQGSDEVVERQGIIALNDTDKLIKGEKVQNVPYVIFTGDHLKIIRTKGFGYIQFGDSVADRMDVYDYLVNGGNLGNVLRLNDWHLLYDLNDDLIQSAMGFDYIEAQIHNGKYDLEKVLEILKVRKDITGELVIKDIPCYNRDEYHNKFIEFFWLPNREQMAIIASNMINRYEIICGNDYLGLKEAEINSDR